MTARGKARRRALDILFEADARDADPIQVLAAHEQRRAAAGNPPLNAYTCEIVAGVAGDRVAIDTVIEDAAIGWTIDRMPAVDRAALRVATWEIRSGDEVPDGVAIAEAVAAVRKLSTDESPAFVNGVLAKIAGEKA